MSETRAHQMIPTTTHDALEAIGALLNPTTPTSWTSALGRARHEARAWQVLCDALDRWDDRSTLPLAIATAHELLEGFEDSARVAPRAWWEAAVSGRREPRLALARQVITSHHQVGDMGLLRLAKSPDARYLTTLRVEDDLVGDEGARAIAHSVVLTRLEALHLGRNRIGADGARALAHSVTLTRLRALNLSNNPIMDAGAQAIAQSLTLRGLEALYLGECAIGDGGVMALALAPMRRLHALDLYGNGALTDAGAEALWRRLDVGFPLMHTLELEGSATSRALRAQLERALDARQ